VAGGTWANRPDLAFHLTGTSASAPVERVRFTGDGKVGIGTASPNNTLEVMGPAGAQLRLSRDIQSNQYLVVGGGAGDTIFNSVDGTNGVYPQLQFQATKGSTTATRLFIDQSGKVGIGTTGPAASLHLRGQNPKLRLDGDADSYYPGLDYYTLNGTWGGSIFAYGSNGLWHDSPNDHVFRTTSSTTERMRIASGGNVGIGTTNPSYLLDVSGDARASRLKLGDGGLMTANQWDGGPTPEYPYVYTITTTGDANTFYPVGFRNSANGVPPGKFVIARSYWEAGPVVSDGDASHIAGLQAVFQTMNTAWADYHYTTLQSYRQVYVRTISDCGMLPAASDGRALWCRLRGGGFVYHVWANYPIDPVQEGSGAVAYNSGGYVFGYPSSIGVGGISGSNAFAPGSSIVPVSAY